MSKAAKKVIYLLALFLLLVSGLAVFINLQKQGLEKEVLSLKGDLEDSENREAAKVMEIKKIKTKLADSDVRKKALDLEVLKAEKEVSNLLKKIDEVVKEKDKWKRRIDAVSSSRDELQDKVLLLEEKLVKTESQVIDQKVEPKKNLEEKKPEFGVAQKPPAIPAQLLEGGNEQYWASILREKAALEIQIEGIQDKLANKAMDIVNLKKSNADMKIEIDALTSQRDDLSMNIKYKSDLVNNLSLELARTKNDTKLTTQRAKRLNEENMNLRQQLKSLVSSKSSLEKSIVRLTQDKGKVERELLQTESVIRNKIDEIWQIKESLDQTFEGSSVTENVELSPIVVTSSSPSASSTLGASSLNGTVVSINDDNNFVIVDLGEKTGVQLGDNLSVYRNSKYIARLEVIQVRKDISAADIKDQWSRIAIGDIIR